MKLFKYTVAFSTVLVLFTACIKKDAPELGDRGSSFIKILESPLNVLYFSPFSNIDSVDLFSLRRDEVSSAKLNQSITVSLLADTAAVTAYNTENGTSFEVLPDSLFSIVTKGITKNGFNYSVTYDAGEMGKELTIGLDGSKWDVTHNYAIAFAIADSAGRRIASSQGSIVVTLASKNIYDGKYKMSAYTLRAGDAAKTGNISNVDYSLITSGVSSVDFSGLQVWADGGGVGIGIPTLTVNPTGTTYPVTVSSPGGAHNAPDYDSRYDPATKTFYISFTWGAGPAARLATDTLVYVGPR